MTGAHRIFDTEDQKRTIATVHPASQTAVLYVLSQTTKGMDGRSPWVWLRLPNGDLLLGTFPQGDTYFAVEDDARYTGE